jgi:excisionase family DNA binding protein
MGIDYTDLLTPEELAARLKVPRSWVYEKTRARSRDPLPVMRIGKYMRFHWTDIEAWLLAHKEGGLT